MARVTLNGRESFHDGITATGTRATFYLFEGEGHGLAPPTSQFVAGQAQILWFRTHLKAP